MWLLRFHKSHDGSAILQIANHQTLLNSMASRGRRVEIVRSTKRLVDSTWMPSIKCCLPKINSTSSTMSFNAVNIVCNTAVDHSESIGH